jgi:hypothetical protein
MELRNLIANSHPLNSLGHSKRIRLIAPSDTLHNENQSRDQVRLTYNDLVHEGLRLCFAEEKRARSAG